MSDKGDKGDDKVKRSKSHIAMSLLHREKSRGEDKSSRNGDDSSSSQSLDPEYAASRTSLTLSPSSGSPSGLLRKQSRNAASKEAVTNSPGKLAPAAALAPSAPTIDKPISVEQSVKIFKLFDALRNGDTAVISKAIRESAALAEEGRTSTSSFASTKDSPLALDGTTILHLAVQCAEQSVIEFVLSHADSSNAALDINSRDRDGNTPLHLAASLGRPQIVRLFLDQSAVNDSILNNQGRTALDVARTPEIFQMLQLSRSLFVDNVSKQIQTLVGKGDYAALEKLVTEPRVQATLDLNSGELVTDPLTSASAGTLLHEAARKRDTKLIQILLLHGADPFRRDKKGKLPQDVTKDEKTRGVLKRSPAAVAAQRGIQEKTVLGSASSQAMMQAAAAGAPAIDPGLAGKDSREMKGYLKKWTNYTSGYKLRWFVLEDGVLSYYKNQGMQIQGKPTNSLDDTGSACRGAINMRIAKLFMDPQDKLRFEIQGKSSVKYHLKANHVVEAKRWFWALNNAIQWGKDEEKAEKSRAAQEKEAFKQAKTDEMERAEQKDKDRGDSADNTSVYSKAASRSGGPTFLSPPSAASRLGAAGASTAASSIVGEEDDAMIQDSQDGSVTGPLSQVPTRPGEDTHDGEYPDDNSSQAGEPHSRDAFDITAQSAKLQLDLLSTVSSALEREKTRNPSTPISSPTVLQAISAYDTGIRSLHGLIVDLLKIARDRESYWQGRLDREVDVRRLWEENMARLVQEHEALQGRVEESEDKRKKTKRALKEVLAENSGTLSRQEATGQQIEEALSKVPVDEQGFHQPERAGTGISLRKKSVFADMPEIDDSDTEDEEFFDAVDAGEVEVLSELPQEEVKAPTETKNAVQNNISAKKTEIEPSFKGYEDAPRKRLKMDADDRPVISLWGILKSMIGKDMTKMTLPVSFNEPTSLLQRVAEDMEYTDLLDSAAQRSDSTERMVYVAAFAASEYSSTTGRVAKPFNPLLAETYEYVRPDKGYRFFVEQVSHHPPVGAAYAESPHWDYYGESAVKSKFYGKSFDINPLGTWFLRLRPATGGEELYTWKKITSSVIGIISGSPTVDNYGPMEIKNWTTGDVCLLDFKARGWRSAGAFEMKGRILDSEGTQRWSIGGHWNDKIYARLSPGYDAAITPPQGSSVRSGAGGNTQAFLVWENHVRPKGIPFNLTPFAVTLNALPDALRPYLPPTDTRLRPDQRAMEDGEYDLAAEEKNRVEEKQRAKRREREASGEVFKPQWFHKGVCNVTGEPYWVFNEKYWKMRDAVAKGGKWEGVEDIF